MAQDLISTPPTRATIDQEDENGNVVRVSAPWSNWFTQVFQNCFATYQSGTTAQRPTTNLWVGRRYFDTSLGTYGKPIWWNKNANAWVDASGALV